MLVSEFIQLTGYQPATVEEYQEIEALYMEFDGDKYEFCKAWAKFNPTKAGSIERARKEAEVMEKEENKVISIVQRYVFKSHKEALTVESFKAMFAKCDKNVMARVIKSMHKWAGITQNWHGDAVWRNYWDLHSMACYGY